MSSDPQEQTGVFVAHVLDMQRNLFAYILTLLPSLEDAKDVLQQTNLVLWSKRDEFRPGSDIQAWVCRIAYFEVLAYRQRWRRNRLQFDSELVGQMAEEVGTVRLAKPDSELEALARCTESLSPADRELLNLRYQEALSAPEIAAKLSRSAVAIRKALFRVRAALHRCIDQRLKVEDRQ